MPPIRRRRAWLNLPRFGRATAAVAACLAIAAAVLCGTSRASDACTIEWDGGAGTSSWDAPANWTGDRLPAASDETCVGDGFGVAFTGSSSVAGLRVDGALTVAGLGSLTVTGTRESSGSGTLTIHSGRLTLDGELWVAAFRQEGGTLLGSGTLSTADLAWTGGAQVGSGATRLTGAGATATFAGGVHTLDASHALSIDAGARVDWTAGDLELRDHATLVNAGLIDIQGDQDMSGCCGDAMTVVNESGATIRKSAGSGQTDLTYALTNDGSLEVGAGTVAISGGDVASRASQGSFDVADGATLAFTGSAFDLGADSTVTGHGSGGLSFKFGIVSFAGSVAAPVAVDGPSARASFDSDVTLPRVELVRGFLSGSGRIATPDLRWEGGVQQGAGSTAIVAGGPGLSISGERQHGLYDRELDVDPGALALWSAATLDMTGPAAIENAGIFDLGDDVSSTACCGSPRLHNAAGGLLRKSLGDGRAAIAAHVQNDGTLVAASGTLALDGGLDNLDRGTLDGGSYSVQATLEIPDANVVRNAAVVTLDGPDSRIADRAGADGLRELAENSASGRLTVTGGRQLEIDGPGRDLRNAGDVTVGAGSLLVAGGAYVQSAGSTRLMADSARLGAAGAAAVAIDGGSLSGTGTIGSSLTNGGGVVEPGLSPGILTVDGDYRQAPGGALAVQIGGTEAGSGHDRLDVTGTATLAGALRVETLDGFLPEPGDEFELVRHAAVEGEFDEVSGLQAGAGHGYEEPSYEQGATWLRRAAVPQASIADVSVAEGDAGDTTASFDVTLSEAPTRTVRIPWRTSDATASDPADYEAASGTLTIPHGHDSGRVAVRVHGDTIDEPDERFGVELSNPARATLARASATATILDDDLPPASEPPPGTGPGASSPGAFGGRPPHAAPPAGPAARPAPCLDRRAPRTSFRRARRPVRLKRRRLQTRGTAADAGCGRLKRVAVAVGRRERGHRGRRCRFLKPNGRLGRVTSCRRPRYLRARGTRRWRLRIRVRLPRGSYWARSMAVDVAGNRELKLRRGRRRSRNLVAFRVR